MKIGLDFQRTDFHIPLQQLHFMGDWKLKLGFTHKRK